MGESGTARRRHGGGEVSAVKKRLRSVAPVAAIVGVAIAAAVAFAIGATPASAFSQWQHDGADHL